jgi:hypothetical protein
MVKAESAVLTRTGACKMGSLVYRQADKDQITRYARQLGGQFGRNRFSYTFFFSTFLHYTRVQSYYE